MIAPDIISDSVPPLHLDDTGEQAMMLMHEYNVRDRKSTHLNSSH